MYQLRQPAEVLRPYVEHYWFVEASAGVDVDIRVDVFVDGRADLIFNFGVPYARAVIGGERRELRDSNFDAQRLVPIRIEQRGRVRTTGVRFHLGGVAPFTRQTLRTFTGSTPPPDAVFGADARALELALGREIDFDVQAQMLDDFFLRALERTSSFDTFKRALQGALESRGTASVDDMAASAGVSARQLDRLFAKHLGIPPKTLAKVLRFQVALSALMGDPGCTLAEVALESGYFDQAHFIKDFRRMSGGVPRGYRGYFPPEGPADFAPNVVVFLQDGPRRPA